MYISTILSGSQKFKLSETELGYRKSKIVGKLLANSQKEYNLILRAKFEKHIYTKCIYRQFSVGRKNSNYLKQY